MRFIKIASYTIKSNSNLIVLLKIKRKTSCENLKGNKSTKLLIYQRL